jgi:hypothetical protein
MRSLILLGLAFLPAILPAPAQAVVLGEVSRDPDGVRSSVVRVESTRGELCSGVLIAPDLVLTAAHCMTDRAAYRVTVVDRGFRQRTLRVAAVAMHPEFVPGTTPRTQPGIDLAMLKLEAPLGADFTPLPPARAGSVGRGELVKLAGFGITADGRPRTARTLRQAHLVSLGTLRVANRVLVVADGETMAETTGAGACRGDSGGPILRQSGFGGYQLLGIVSWSSGAFDTRVRSACGGFTAVTPVAEHIGWIQAGSVGLENQVAAMRGPRQTDWMGR